MREYVRDGGAAVEDFGGLCCADGAAQLSMQMESLEASYRLYGMLRAPPLFVLALAATSEIQYSIFLLNFSVIFPSTSVTRNLQNEIEHLLQQISKRLYLCCVLPFTITSALIYTRDHGQIKSEAAKSKK